MVRATVDDIQRDLGGYLHRVETGETVVITRANLPVAELTPIVRLPQGRRPMGLCAGEFVVPDDFGASLPEDVIRDFEG